VTKADLIRALENIGLARAPRAFAAAEAAELAAFGEKAVPGDLKAALSGKKHEGASPLAEGTAKLLSVLRRAWGAQKAQAFARDAKGALCEADRAGALLRWNEPDAALPPEALEARRALQKGLLVWFGEGGVPPEAPLADLLLAQRAPAARERSSAPIKAPADNSAILREKLDRSESLAKRLSQENTKLSAEVSRLGAGLAKAERTASAPPEMRRALADSLMSGRKLSVTDALRLAQALYPERLTVLGPAFESAKKSDRSGFQQAARLLQLLLRLGGPYFDAAFGLSKDSPESVFSNAEYSAHESDTVNSTHDRGIRSVRTAVWNGRTIPLERHLRIGVANDASKSIRCYFEIVRDAKRILIGYCGPHPRNTKTN
jgi:hypothetical protein